MPSPIAFPGLSTDRQCYIRVRLGGWDNQQSGPDGVGVGGREKTLGFRFTMVVGVVGGELRLEGKAQEKS
jgi:hypothetical protein